jgi:hypothetical protein
MGQVETLHNSSIYDIYCHFQGVCILAAHLDYYGHMATFKFFEIQ